LRLKQNSLQSQLYKSKSKIDILSDYKKNKTNLHQGVKIILQNKDSLSGINGIVADLFKVDESNQKAIEAVLSNAMQHIVVEHSSDAVRAINFLKQNRAGRATFIPLSAIKEKYISNNYLLAIESKKGFIGRASDLIEVKPKYQILIDFLLGSIIIVDTIENAKSISELIEKKYMIVSQEGDMIRVGGVLSGGQASRNSGVFGIEDQIEKLNAIIPSLESGISQVNQEMNRISSKVSEERSVMSELYMEIAKVREKDSNLQEQFNFLNTKYESMTKNKIKFNEDMFPQESSEFLESEKSSLQAGLNAKHNQIISLNNEIGSLNISKNKIEKSVRDIDTNLLDTKDSKNKAEFYIKNSLQRLGEEYGMTFENAAEEAGLLIDREEARDFVSRVRKEIKELGSVNVDSIDTYQEVKKRHEKLRGHEEELTSAQDKILTAIDQMDQIIINRLDNTVKSVSIEFENVFKTMFGGGQATIKYTNPSNLLETGIDVIAQPPGKSVRNLKLFSGGEKAIIAISLLFAILKSKPLPLCILDEVEAALDDANVIRYANFLQELKKSTQFIVITHRVGTMERADHLFGATMQQRGVTSFFSVKLKTAKELIQ
jgi:chromosome segregation protein